MHVFEKKQKKKFILASESKETYIFHTVIQSDWMDMNEILVAGTKGEEKAVDKSQVEGMCREMSLS